MSNSVQIEDKLCEIASAVIDNIDALINRRGDKGLLRGSLGIVIFMKHFTDHFPEDRIIIWCANFHGAKDISQTQYREGSLDYFYFQLMGEHLAHKLGDGVYSLAFTSLTQSPTEYASPGLLEKEIAKATGDNGWAFIDFVPLRFAPGYRNKEFESSVIMKKSGNG